MSNKIPPLFVTDPDGSVRTIPPHHKNQVGNGDMDIIIGPEKPLPCTLCDKPTGKQIQIKLEGNSLFAICALCLTKILIWAGARALNELDPEKFVDDIVAREATLAAMKKRAKAYVEQHGDIVTDAGNCFGFNKPKANRKPTASTYTRKGSE